MPYLAGENQLTSAGGVTYTYDGDGRRVVKSSGKIYWYGSGSAPLDETDSAGNTNNSSFFEYGFFGGQRIARRDYQNNVNYYFADHLGTSRVSTNSSGSICYDADFYPFGGERTVSNSCGFNYKFTGYERDSESGLDYASARHYNNALGRFMQPDPLRRSRLLPPGASRRASAIISTVDAAGPTTRVTHSPCASSRYGGSSSLVSWRKESSISTTSPHKYRSELMRYASELRQIGVWGKCGAFRTQARIGLADRTKPDCARKQMILREG